MEDSSTPSCGTPTAWSNNNGNGNTNVWGPMQKIKRTKARQQKYSPYEYSAKWIMNPKIMNPNNDFQVVKHRSEKTINIDFLDSKQEQNNHSIINEKHQSPYNILNDNDGGEMDDVDNEGTINIASGDANIGGKKDKPQSKRGQKSKIPRRAAKLSQQAIIMLKKMMKPS